MSGQGSVKRLIPVFAERLHPDAECDKIKKNTGGMRHAGETSYHTGERSL